MPRFLAFQEHCCKIFAFAAPGALAKKLVASRYKKFAVFKLVERSSAPFRYGMRLNLLHQKNFFASVENDRFDPLRPAPSLTTRSPASNIMCLNYEAKSFEWQQLARHCV